MNPDSYAEIASLLDDATTCIQEAAEALQQAARKAKAAGAPSWFAGQLDAYTIPHLQQWIAEDSSHQPGNLPHLLAQLEEEDGA